MAKKESKDDKETMPIRITTKALEVVRIAASFKGMSQTEYASKVLMLHANADIDRAINERVKAAKEKKEKGTKE